MVSTAYAQKGKRNHLKAQGREAGKGTREIVPRKRPIVADSPKPGARRSRSPRGRDIAASGRSRAIPRPPTKRRWRGRRCRQCGQLAHDRPHALGESVRPPLAHLAAARPAPSFTPRTFAAFSPSFVRCEISARSFCARAAAGFAPGHSVAQFPWHNFRGTISVAQFPWHSFRGTISRVPLPASRPCAFRLVSLALLRISR